MEYEIIALHSDAFTTLKEGVPVHEYVETMDCGDVPIRQEMGTEVIWVVMPIVTTATIQQCMDAYMHKGTDRHSFIKISLWWKITCGRYPLVSVDK